MARNLKPWRNRWLALLSLVVVLGIAASAALYYRFHLLWLYEESRVGLQDVHAVPDSPMPDSPTPDGWLRCRVGCIEFSLPPELAGNRIATKSGAAFGHGSCAVIVGQPYDAGEFSALLATASELCPQSQRFTMPRLRREWYQASSDDFRWSMTPKEVRWHIFCISWSKLTRTLSDGHTESLFRQDLDGIIHFGDERAVFDWQSSDLKWSGYMHFNEHGQKIDPTWIRAVCQSLKVSDEVETEPAASPPGP